MTDQHRATPEQCATTERRGAGDYAISSCLLELRDRIEALEAFDHHPLLAAVLAQSKTVAHLGNRVERLEELHAAVADLNQRFSLDPLVDRIKALEATQHAHIAAAALRSSAAAEAGARYTMEQLRSQPGSWQPLKTETTYGEASDHARRMVRNISNSPETVEGSFEMGGIGYRYTEAMAAEDDELLAGVDPAADAQQLTLVDRVTDAIREGGRKSIEDEARAAIREVAEWMRERGWGDPGQPDALIREANQ